MHGMLVASVLGAALRDGPQKMKNIHYAGQGYDIVRGNPRCAGGCKAAFDPGFFGTGSVIDLSYSGRTTPDGRYLIPDSLDIESAVACSLVTETSVVHSSYDYSCSLSASM